MTLKSDIIDDSEAYFSNLEFAEEITYTTSKGLSKTFCAVFDENSVGLVMTNSSQTTDYEAIIAIPRTLLDQPNQGDKIIRHADGLLWRVERVTRQDEISYDVFCVRKLLQKVKN